MHLVLPILPMHFSREDAPGGRLSEVPADREVPADLAVILLLQLAVTPRPLDRILLVLVSLSCLVIPPSAILLLATLLSALRLVLCLSI